MPFHSNLPNRVRGVSVGYSRGNVETITPDFTSIESLVLLGRIATFHSNRKGCYDPSHPREEGIKPRDLTFLDDCRHLELD